MPTFTAVADANGDFTVPFLSSYTSGQKVIVKAEKDGAEKSIELFAPSEVTGGGVIQFSGNMNNFPLNVGVITLTSEIAGVIQANAMKSGGIDSNIFYRATGLIIQGNITEIGNYGFAEWSNASLLVLPNSLTKIGQYAFHRYGVLSTNAYDVILPDTVNTIEQYAFNYAGMKNFDIGASVKSIPTHCFSYTAKIESFNYRNVQNVGANAFYQSNLKFNHIPNSVLTLGNGSYAFAKSIEISIGLGVTIIPASCFYQCTLCEKFTIGLNITSIASNGIAGMLACEELICLPTSPPAIESNSLTGLKNTCVIKVPAASLNAYQTAANWSAFASQMIGV